ncbi:DUF1697 domain-containing protein [Paenibacillus mesophilus]|uniref:DUF1697 domain-containing protein n=1 Tax=Paenibacillus mesophilus TaxID=2582849 RepID=UPI00110DE47A|nr:DUF1697 domain-containing protein [Paenibacillus mesophilus]TMV42658.1 DUF1697 domain-containing protein [Paenibacillus mesophilus]
MTTYIALLRGINVGGKNKIKMAELKSALEAIGLGRVQTYIQSGNVVFESGEEADLLRGRIEREIKQTFGIPAAVILRTAAELERIVTDCPFAADALSEGESLQVCLLTEAPSQEKVDRLSEGKSEIDEYRVQGREIYLLFRQSVLDSKLAANIPKLGDSATTRNWSTINKLHFMARSMQA